MESSFLTAKIYLDFLEAAFLAVDDATVFLVEDAAALIAEAGFKIIDLTLRKELALVTVFLGIKTLTAAAFLGAFNLTEVWADSWLIAASQSLRLEFAWQPLFFQI